MMELANKIVTAAFIVAALGAIIAGLLFPDFSLLNIGLAAGIGFVFGRFLNA